MPRHHSYDDRPLPPLPTRRESERARRPSHSSRYDAPPPPPAAAASRHHSSRPSSRESGSAAMYEEQRRRRARQGGPPPAFLNREWGRQEARAAHPAYREDPYADPPIPRRGSNNARRDAPEVTRHGVYSLDRRQRTASLRERLPSVEHRPSREEVPDYLRRGHSQRAEYVSATSDAYIPRHPSAPAQQPSSSSSFYHSSSSAAQQPSSSSSSYSSYSSPPARHYRWDPEATLPVPPPAPSPPAAVPNWLPPTAPEPPRYGGGSGGDGAADDYVAAPAAHTVHRKPVPPPAAQREPVRRPAWWGDSMTEPEPFLPSGYGAAPSRRSSNSSPTISPPSSHDSPVPSDPPSPILGDRLLPSRPSPPRYYSPPPESPRWLPGPHLPHWAQVSAEEYQAVGAEHWRANSPHGQRRQRPVRNSPSPPRGGARRAYDSHHQSRWDDPPAAWDDLPPAYREPPQRFSDIEREISRERHEREAAAAAEEEEARRRKSSWKFWHRKR